MESWDHCCSAANPCVLVVSSAGLCLSPGMLPGGNVLSQDVISVSSNGMPGLAMF